jgi:hypothetical protein
MQTAATLLLFPCQFALEMIIPQQSPLVYNWELLSKKHPLMAENQKI